MKNYRLVCDRCDRDLFDGEDSTAFIRSCNRHYARFAYGGEDISCHLCKECFDRITEFIMNGSD